MNAFPLSQVLIITTHLESVEQLSQMIEKSFRFKVGTLEAEKLGKKKTTETPDVILVDVASVGVNEIDIVNEVLAQFVDVPVIVVSDALDPVQVRQLFKLKIHDWLSKPVEAAGILSVLQSALRTSKFSGNRVHAVISAVGGAGATTLAVSMADLLAKGPLKKDNGSVALFDLDFSTGNCSYVLNMVNSFNLETVAASPSRIDVEFINLIRQEHQRGFFVYSFKRPDINTELNGYELVLRMLDAVTVQHEHTFLDIPYYETEWKDDVLSAVNTCTIVSELNLPAIKHTLDVVQRVRGLRGENFPIHVIFNKHIGGLFGQRVSKSKLATLFGKTSLFYIPDNRNLLEESIDRGVPPSEISTRSRFLRALAKYMKTTKLTEGAIK